MRTDADVDLAKNTSQTTTGTTFDSLPDKLQIHLMTKYEDAACDKWESMNDKEQLQKALDFYKEVEQVQE